MENTFKPKQYGGHSNLSRLLLLLFLAGLQPGLSSDGEPPEPDDDNKAGPANVSITGPDLMTPSVSHTFSCHAYCRPSCSYAWKTDKGPWIGSQGNVISITPQEMDHSKMLICEATNSVSGLFDTATRNMAVAYGPSEVHIKGPDVVEIAKKCEAQNTASRRTATTVKIVQVAGFDRNRSTRPEGTLAVLLLAFIISSTFTLM
ncbi:hypothetical protein FQN60_005528 [Etheostoma spectabile]|uniref:Ig-like domain-containing protein n=1 Tax=Etheostoma spectabile TaxID=54343 RepID=A0A5J5CG29_9PERO|nr:hypothetical protein FQN60_005528 [Etheostoma spectabile]